MNGIYIHIPFCISKCKYCDFSSFPDRLSMQDDYIDILIKEMINYKGSHADSVYIGGGTPSVLKSDNIKKLLFAVNDIFKLQENSEFTMEVNPATVDFRKATIMKDYGVNRISIGAQSFVDTELKRIGRIHNSNDIRVTFEVLRNAGIKNLSLDLMYALPNQTLGSFAFSVDEACKLAPEHISCYGLKFEEGTPLYAELKSGTIEEQDEDAFAEMYDFLRKKLIKNGYQHYEISNFSLPGFESRHNTKYWTNKDYIGFGVSAASKIGNRRYSHTSDFVNYINSCELDEDYVMSKEEQMSEFVILGLRMLNKGADKEEFYQNFKLHMDDVFGDEIKKVSPYIINTKKSIKLKPESLLVSNAVMCEFV